MIRLETVGADVDGDLHYYTMRVWYDEVVDGAVDTSGEPFEVSGTLGDECEVATSDVAMLLCVTGNPPFAADLEWGAILMDDEDNASALAVQPFTTPDESGTY